MRVRNLMKMKRLKMRTRSTFDRTNRPVLFGRSSLDACRLTGIGLGLEASADPAAYIGYVTFF